VNARSASLLSWLLLLILTLGIGAMRIAFWARAGSETQHIALAEMIIIQLGVGTMLFPLLMRERLGVVAAFTTFPFLQLAGFLTATPVAPLLATCVAILIWFFGLSLWMGAIRSLRNQMILVAILNWFVIGGPLFRYLVREFSDSPEQPTWMLPTLLDPLTTLLTQSQSTVVSPSSFAASIILLLSGAIALAVGNNKSFRAKLSTSFPLD
jgi:hypothetical protein